MVLWPQTISLASGNVSGWQLLTESLWVLSISKGSHMASGHIHFQKKAVELMKQSGDYFSIYQFRAGLKSQPKFTVLCTLTEAFVIIRSIQLLPLSYPAFFRLHNCGFWIHFPGNLQPAYLELKIPFIPGELACNVKPVWL